jgi:hypothetical protein
MFSYKSIVNQFYFINLKKNIEIKIENVIYTKINYELKGKI